MEREFLGDFVRNSKNYYVYVTWKNDQFYVEVVYVVWGAEELSFTLEEYDKTNKLHVNAMIVVAKELFNASSVIDYTDQPGWPNDETLQQSREVAS